MCIYIIIYIHIPIYIYTYMQTHEMERRVINYHRNQRPRKIKGGQSVPDGQFHWFPLISMEINWFQRRLDIHGLPLISIEINGFPVILESIGYPLTGVIINWFLWTNNDIHRFLSISTEIDEHLKNYPWIVLEVSFLGTSIEIDEYRYLFIKIDW